MAERVVLLSVPQLLRRDVTPGCLACLDAISARGSICDLVPPFPGLAASAFATLVTGTGPYEHGVVGDAFFDRQERRVVCRPLPDGVVTAPRLWDRLREARPGAKSLLWFGPNARGADVTFSASSDREGGLETTPPDLEARLTSRFGSYPCQKAGQSEPPRLECSTWILKTAAALIAEEEPDLAIVRIPYLGQVARRFGPDGREAGRAIRSLEAVLAPFVKAITPEALLIAATESVSTPVSGPVFPNRVLRALNLLALTPSPGGGYDVDTERSAAFALVDHQIAHIYLNDPSQAATVASAFAGLNGEGVASVAPGARRAELGMDHPRSGDVILIAEPDRWFAPDWWTSSAERPSGPVPSGLLLGAPRNGESVQGSLGAPPPGEHYLGVVVASRPGVLGDAPRLQIRDVAGIVLKALGAA